MSKKRKANHRKGPKLRVPLTAGDHRRSVVAATDGSYTRVTVEYQSHSADHDGKVAEAIASEMYGAARLTDLRILAAQRPGDIIEGEILTPDGRLVVERWIPTDGELLMLKARAATIEDLATMDRYGEPPDQIEPRKAEARRMLRARDEENGRTGVLREHGDILEAAQS